MLRFLETLLASRASGRRDSPSFLCFQDATKFECICRLPTARYTEVDNSGTLLGCGGVKPFRRPSGRGATALLLESRVKAGSCKSIKPF
eukprot:scaffold2848_cov218-Pinguiococcus_pyrenoidosus.AAC.3